MDHETIERKVEDRFGCDCAEKEIRFRIYSNGAKQFYRQCQRCGNWEGPLKKDSISFKDRQLAPAADEELQRTWREKRREYHSQLYQAARQAESREWFNEHSEYLQTEKWRKKAQKALERDNHTCQACLVRKATQVHHLNYNHWQNEPLFELTSVCGVCHDFITKLDRQRRGATDLLPR